MVSIRAEHKSRLLGAVTDRPDVGRCYTARDLSRSCLRQ